MIELLDIAIEVMAVITSAFSPIVKFAQWILKPLPETFEIEDERLMDELDGWGTESPI